MADVTLQVFRGGPDGGKPVEYKVPIAPGMVVLDALHYIQGFLAPDLAVRWNCKAGKCGSCSAEGNGRPRLTGKTRMDALPAAEAHGRRRRSVKRGMGALPAGSPFTVRPMKKFPVIKDLVTDVWWNYTEIG